MAENLYIGKMQESAARRVFHTPELLANILEHIPIVDFVKVKQAHPAIMATALEYPALRYKFYLEADPAADKEKPVINPAFVEFLAKQGGWCFLPAPTESNSSSREGVVWCQGHMAFDDHRRQFARKVPAEMLLFQPPPESIRICAKNSSQRFRWPSPGPAKVPYNASDQTLKGAIYAILGATFECGFDELSPRAKQLFEAREALLPGSKADREWNDALCLQLAFGEIDLITYRAKYRGK